MSQEWWDREVVLKGQDHNPDPERNKPQSDAELLMSVTACHRTNFVLARHRIGGGAVVLES